jgi:hypothetical protein
VKKQRRFHVNNGPGKTADFRKRLTRTANQIAAYVNERRDDIVLLESTLQDLETRMNTYKTALSDPEMEMEKEEEIAQGIK